MHTQTVATTSEVYTAGVDLVEISRIGRLHLQWSDRLRTRLCAGSELSALADLPSELGHAGLALAFGIKESMIKAAGGMDPGARFTDVDSSRLIRQVPYSPTLSGTVDVSGTLGTKLLGGTTRACSGGAALLNADTWLCWVTIERAA